MDKIKYRKILIFIGISMLILGFKSPMLLIFPLGIFTILFKNKLTALFGKVPKDCGFIVAGVMFGLITEFFAIIENLKIPMGQKILLGQTFGQDITYAFFYYTLVALAWYLILHKINFSKKEVFLITGLYGILVEETGRVFWGIFTVDINGLLYAIMVMFVYGLFMTLAYTVTENNFSDNRIPAKIWHYSLIMGLLFIQWAIYGNFVLPNLMKMFS